MDGNESMTGARKLMPSPDPADLPLVPRVVRDGPCLEFDLPGLLVGAAEYDEGPTGCTVFAFPAGAAMAVDIRGGSPGVVGDHGWTHAVCFAGGSIYGLEAVSGVVAELLAQGTHSTRWDELALVAGGIVYDFHGRNTAVYPDKALGRAALRAAVAGRFPLGARGAGRNVTVGNGFAFDRGEPGGQGGAFRQAGGVKVAVFTVVNAIGAIVDRDGRVVRGHLDPATGRRGPIAAELDRLTAEIDARPISPVLGNTTVTLLATNAALDPRELRQLGRQVHDSMARAIQPFHTPRRRRRPIRRHHRRGDRLAPWSDRPRRPRLRGRLGRRPKLRPGVDRRRPARAGVR
jgi:L-aminopeptidase/D-esterase-like protein